jgi:hypothetical protein
LLQRPVLVHLMQRGVRASQGAQAPLRKKLAPAAQRVHWPSLLHSRHPLPLMCLEHCRDKSVTTKAAINFHLEAAALGAQTPGSDEAASCERVSPLATLQPTSAHSPWLFV